MQGKAKPGESLAHVIELVFPTEPFVHMGLQANGIDLDPGIEDFLHELFIPRPQIKVVEDQLRPRVLAPRLFNREPHHRHTSLVSADPGNGILDTVGLIDKLGHDDNFVDRVPRIDEPGEILDLSADSPPQQFFGNG
ncbi:hypothetical protein AS189_18485 [Arthrobacter alpinus]|uniref:Uncharacterized protein n=1 Tax=Arthrobacter alpinus TaxID=656366 RepID=A0A0S2M3V6_9MICC|nr:hypothetical protein AS189_18485 [Arthrobacter alpinus]